MHVRKPKGLLDASRAFVDFRMTASPYEGRVAPAAAANRKLKLKRRRRSDEASDDGRGSERRDADHR